MQSKKQTNKKNINVGADLTWRKIKNHFQATTVFSHFCPAPWDSNTKFRDAKEDTVSKQREHDEVDRGEHAAANASLRLDPVVHDGVPVLASQNLRKNKEAAKHCANLTECRIKLLYRLKGYEHRLIEGLSVSPLGDRRYTDQSFPLIKMTDNNLSCSIKSIFSHLFRRCQCVSVQVCEEGVLLGTQWGWLLGKYQSLSLASHLQS